MPPEVLAALGRARSSTTAAPDFRVVYERCLERLREVFRTENEVLLFAASGTGAFESAVANLTLAGRPRARRLGRARSASAGRRWRALRLRRRPPALRVGRDAGARRPRAQLRETGAKAVAARPLGDVDRRRRRPRRRSPRRAREAGALASSTPSRPSAPSRSRRTRGALDVVVTGSQKALMTPPGPRARLGLRARARGRGRRTSPRFYFDWARTRKAQQAARRRFTPAVSLVAGLDVALGLLLDEGLEAAFARHVAPRPRLPRRRRRRWGSSSSRPTRTARAVVTAIRTPDGVDAVELRLAAARPPRRSRSRAARAIADGQSSGSATSAGSTSSTSRPRSPAVELALDRARRATIERGVAVAAALDAYDDRRRRVTSAQVLVREPIAEPGVELLRRTLRRRRRRRLRARGDHRPLRRDRRPLGDEADGRADRARASG